MIAVGFVLFCLALVVEVVWEDTLYRSDWRYFIIALCLRVGLCLLFFGVVVWLWNNLP